MLWREEKGVCVCVEGFVGYIFILFLDIFSEKWVCVFVILIWNFEKKRNNEV